MLPLAINIALQHYKRQHLQRQRLIIDERMHNKITHQNKILINFCSNDYLGLACHPDIKQAFIAGAHRYGIGSTSSAQVSGYFKPHYALEEAFAAFLNREKAVLFNSGYHANIGVLTTLANRQSHIMMNKDAHASLLNGAHLSRATLHRYQDFSALEKLLERYNQSNKLLVTETISSMEGEFADLKKLAVLAKQYQAVLIADDAHGLGDIDHANIPCLISPLGKTFASMGAIASGSRELIEALIQLAKTHRYTTALPPALCCSLLMTLKVIQQENWRKEKLKNLIIFFIKAAKERSIALISEDMTPIKAILINGNEKITKLKNYLLKQGFLVAHIRPPTAKTPRLRISLNCMHAEKEIIDLLDLIKDYQNQHP